MCIPQVFTVSVAAYRSNVLHMFESCNKLKAVPSVPSIWGNWWG